MPNISARGAPNKEKYFLFRFFIAAFVFYKRETTLTKTIIRYAIK